MDNASLVLSLTVSDVSAALDFLTAAFDAEVVVRMPGPDGSIVHSEVMIGEDLLYISSEFPDWRAKILPEGTLAPCLFGLNVDDPDAVFAKAIAAGAKEIEAPTTQFWGMRTAIIADPFGYRWNLRKLVEELSEEEIMRRAQAAAQGG
ncbi:MAG: VOC family protein [Verrucomicrobiota bacterium]